MINTTLFYPFLCQFSNPVGIGRSTVTFSSSIIGIFQMKFFTVGNKDNGENVDNKERTYIQMEEDVEIVIGRDKVEIINDITIVIIIKMMR